MVVNQRLSTSTETGKERTGALRHSGRRQRHQLATGALRPTRRQRRHRRVGRRRRYHQRLETRQQNQRNFANF